MLYACGPNQSTSGGCPVDRSEISRVETYLRQKFGNDTIAVDALGRDDESAEISIGGEFIGVLYKDEDEGEVSFAFHMAIIDKDLPG